MHMIVFAGVEVTKREVRSMWRRTLSVTGPLEVDAVPLTDGDMVSVYIGKYCGKPSSLLSLDNPAYLNSNGRHWGTTRRRLIPLCEQVVFRDLTQVELSELVKIASEKIENFDYRHPKSFVLLGEICQEAVEKFLDKGLAERFKVG
jgi:hypothetical protein